MTLASGAKYLTRGLATGFLSPPPLSIAQLLDPQPPRVPMLLDGLMDHQKAGVRWLLDNPKGMLAWEMGVGKTATAGRAWELTAAQGPLLVICNASARENWRRELQRFCVDRDFPPTCQVVMSAGRAGSAKIDPTASVVIVNYDKLQQPGISNMLRRPWGAIVLDEAHMLKTPGAKRTRLVYGGAPVLRPLRNYTDRIWPLTGTPMPNHPAELWTHAFSLWPEAIRYNGVPMDLPTFEAGFCVMRQNEHGYSIVGGRNLAELRERLAPHINRLKRKDVLTLPPLRIDSWPLDLANMGKLPDCPELAVKLAHYGSVDHFDQGTLDAYLACINASAPQLATLRRETGTLKAIAATWLLVDELENSTDQKFVVFCHHKDAIETLAKGLAKFRPAVLSGATTDTKRQPEIDRFNTDPTCRVFIGQLQAAGSSINLQAADNVVFVEASWSPGENDQALSRVYRAGQTKPVLVRFTYLKGSIDEAVNRALARKAAMIAQVVN